MEQVVQCYRLRLLVGNLFLLFCAGSLAGSARCLEFLKEIRFRSVRLKAGWRVFTLLFSDRCTVFLARCGRSGSEGERKVGVVVKHKTTRVIEIVFDVFMALPIYFGCKQRVRKPVPKLIDRSQCTSLRSGVDLYEASADAMLRNRCGYRQLVTAMEDPCRGAVGGIARRAT